MGILGTKGFIPGSPMIIIGILFFVFGFITWLGSVLIPYLKIACGLNNFESYLVNGLGAHLKKGSALMIMVIVGGALLPLLYGKMTDAYSAHFAYWLLIPCYAIIISYAFKGYRPR